MSDGPTRTVTLKDVAQKVGVTPAAVSMALSGHSRISRATADRVRAAAAELGYVPSSAAKALRKQRSGAIALIVPNSTQHVFGHSYFMHVLTGVSSAANERDVQVLVSTSASEAPTKKGRKRSGTDRSKLMRVSPSIRSPALRPGVVAIVAISETSEPCSISTPLGRPVEPEVKIT